MQINSQEGRQDDLSNERWRELRWLGSVFQIPYNVDVSSTKCRSKPHPELSGVAMRVAREMSPSLCIVLLLMLTLSAASAQNKRPRVRNIVLVHGAWVDGSGWKGVY